MNSLPRFFVEATHWQPPHFQLTGQEAHHAHTVLRIKQGTQARLFQGEGQEWLAEVTFASKSQVELKGIEPIQETQLAAEVLLLQALPKGSKMELIVEKSVELGVSEIWPLSTTRSVMRLDAQQAAKKTAKWQRLALEAAKQCGHPRLPLLQAPQSLLEALNKLAQTPPDLLLLTSLQADAQPLAQVLQQSPLSNSPASPDTPQRPRLAVLIGPEGDFTTEEIQLCQQHQAQAITLGPLVLRTETAAICALAQLLAVLG